MEQNATGLKISIKLYEDSLDSTVHPISAEIRKNIHQNIEMFIDEWDLGFSSLSKTLKDEDGNIIGEIAAVTLNNNQY